MTRRQKSADNMGCATIAAGLVAIVVVLMIVRTIVQVVADNLIPLAGVAVVVVAIIGLLKAFSP